MSNDTKNQGEGDKESANKYNKEQREFIQSEEGKKKIDKAGEIDTDSQELKDAVKEGKSKAKENDPAVTRKYD